MLSDICHALGPHVSSVINKSLPWVVTLVKDCSEQSDQKSTDIANFAASVGSSCRLCITCVGVCVCTLADLQCLLSFGVWLYAGAAIADFYSNQQQVATNSNNSNSNNHPSQSSNQTNPKSKKQKQTKNSASCVSIQCVHW